MKNLRQTVSGILHPWLVVLIPILFVAANNLSQAPGKEIVLAASLGLALATGLFGIIFAFTRRTEKTALLTSVVLIALFIYGPLFELSYRSTINPWLYSGGLVSLLGATVFSIGRWSLKRESVVATANQFLSVFGLLMLAMIAFNGVQQPAFGLKLQKLSSLFKKIPVPNQGLPADPIIEEIQPAPIIKAKQLPDIYYIILDGYARSDTLARTFGYDNQPFEKALAQQGFYIAPQSTSNYPMTHLSLASSLNMRHVDQLAAENGVKNPQPYMDLISQPKIAEVLKQAGYQYITISSGWGPTGAASPYSDLHFSTKLSKISNYHKTLLAMTPLKLWIGSAEAHLRLFAFDTLERMPTLNTHPKFVFMHLVMPHPPAYFDSQGNIINITDTHNHHYHDKDQYIGQLQFLNTKVLHAVTALLQNSEQPPIILLQADHGSEVTLENFTKGTPSAEQVQERFAIFNAYFGPQPFQDLLYSTITPVNSFRVVLNYLELGTWEKVADSNFFQWHFDETGIQDVSTQVVAMNG